MKINNKLKHWAEQWYNYSFNNEECEEMTELKEIIKQIKELENGNKNNRRV